jgi:zeaxanthin glucosyltransferase
MSRFLFVVPPLLGHIQPARAIAAELTGRGHQVAWCGSLMSLRPVLGDDAVIFKTGSRIHRPQADRGLASLKSLWGEFIVSYARFTRPAVAKAVAEFQPDVVVSDQHTPAGALVAHASGLPWATLACSTIELTRPYRSLPRVEAWIQAQLDRIRADAGVSGEGFDLRFSPDLVLSLTSERFAGRPVADAPPGATAAVRQVGPCFGPRADDPDFDWDWLDERKQLILLSTGTLAAELADDFYRRALAALAGTGERWQAILVTDPATVPDPPEHVRVVARVPMLALMPRLSAVVCHGGLNTVSEALAHGVPLVVAPIRHDQPVNASLVAAAGAGLRITFNRFSPAELRTALETVLSNPGYRAAAAAVAESFAAAGGSRAAAEHLEELADALSDAALSTAHHQLAFAEREAR